MLGHCKKHGKNSHFRPVPTTFSGPVMVHSCTLAASCGQEKNGSRGGRLAAPLEPWACNLVWRSHPVSTLPPHPRCRLRAVARSSSQSTAAIIASPPPSRSAQAPKIGTSRCSPLPGQTRAGRTYSVCSFHAQLECTCPDAVQNKAVCKHMRALQVLGLVPKSARPGVVAQWETIRSAARRRPPVAPGPAAEGPAERPRNIAKSRRTHVPNLPTAAAAAASEFLSGFRAAIVTHVAGMQSGGAS